VILQQRLGWRWLKQLLIAAAVAELLAAVAVAAAAAELVAEVALAVQVASARRGQSWPNRGYCREAGC
jgi:hypothetical protein